MIKIIIILALLLSGCSSWAKVHRDEAGLICKVEYSRGQDVEITKDGFKGSNKIDPLKDIINISGLKN